MARQAVCLLLHWWKPLFMAFYKKKYNNIVSQMWRLFLNFTFVLLVGQNRLFEDPDHPQETVINIYLFFYYFATFYNSLRKQ